MKKLASLYLCLDTSIKGAQFSLIRESSGKLETLAYVFRGTNHAAAASVASLVGDTMKSLSYTWQDIDTFFVAHGPGSFTGIKVGLAFAQGIQLAQPELKVQTYSSLDMLARLNPSKICMLPATKSQGYAVCYENKGFERWIVNLDTSESVVELRDLSDRKLYDLSTRSSLCFLSLLDWGNLEVCCDRRAYAFEKIDFFAETGSRLSLCAVETLSGEEASDLEPNYCRYSAPEEAQMVRNK